MCRVCREREENIAHILKECEATKVEVTPEEVLNEDGRGCEIMKRIDRIRVQKGKGTKEERNNEGTQQDTTQ